MGKLTAPEDFSFVVALDGFTAFATNHRSSIYISRNMIRFFLAKKKKRGKCSSTSQSEFIPLTVVGWLFTEMWFFSEAWEGACFSGGSATTVASDGTRVARSGGWSFPTVGLACESNKKAQFIHCINEKPRKAQIYINITSRSTYAGFFPIEFRNLSRSRVLSAARDKIFRSDNDLTVLINWADLNKHIQAFIKRVTSTHFLKCLIVTLTDWRVIRQWMEETAFLSFESLI